jgi:MFS family permease
MYTKSSRSSGVSGRQLVMVRDFRLLLTGSYVSMFGSRVTTIACPLLALYLTGSPFTAGLVAFVANVPSVLAYMPAGALVDRWNPRRTMLFCESGRGIAIGLVALTLLAGKPNIIVVLVAVFFEETLEVFSTLADQRCVRSLVPPEWASSVQAQIEARNHAVTLAGRPFGVFLFSLKPMLPFLTDALTFVVSVASIINVKSRDAFFADVSNMPKLRLLKEISDGIKWLVGDKYAQAAMVLSAGTTLIGQALLIVFLTEAHRALLSPVMMGLTLAASGIGGLLGSAVAPWWTRWRPKQSQVSLILVQMLAWALALATLAVLGARHVALMALVMAAFSLAGALGNIEIATHLTQRVEYNMVARAASIYRLITLSACAVGPMLGGVLYQLYGAEGAVITLWMITSALAIGAWLTPSIHPGGEVAVTIRDASVRALQRWVYKSKTSDPAGSHRDDHALVKIEVTGFEPKFASRTAVNIDWKLYELNGRSYQGRPKDSSIQPADISPLLASLLEWRVDTHRDRKCTCQHDDATWCPGMEYFLLAFDNARHRRSNLSRSVRPAAEARCPSRDGRYGRPSVPVLIDMSAPWPGVPLPPWPPAMPGQQCDPPTGRRIAQQASREGFGRCAACARSTQLRLDGTLINHRSGADRCAGSLLPPAELPVLATWLALLTEDGQQHGHQVMLDGLNIRYVLQAGRTGRAVPGMRGVCKHIAPEWRTGLMNGLQRTSEESLAAHAAISPRSALPPLDGRLMAYGKPVHGPEARNHPT